MAGLKVLLYEEMDSRGVNHLREHAEVVFASSLDERALLSQVTDVDGIVIRANGSVTRRLIEAAPRLKVIGRHGVGVETIDIEAATEHGIYVVNTPTANVESVAEHAVGMMIVLAKRMREGDLALREGRWGVRYEYIGFELKGRTPINNEQERLYMIQGVKSVTDAFVSQGSGIMDFVEECKALQPDIFIVNEDGNTPAKQKLCKEHGVEYVVLQREPQAR